MTPTARHGEVTGGPVPDGPSREPFDVESIRKDFPLLAKTVHGRPIVYLDSAATALQPRHVLNAMEQYYEATHANVHRGVYATAEEATHRYEDARTVVGRFIGAPDPAREVVFTKNATESLNLVAHSWARSNLQRGDAVLLTEMEHHANIVPWLTLAEERGVELRYLPIDDAGRLDLSDLDRMLDGVRLVGVTAMSNVLGTINPLADIAAAAHAAGAVVVADGAQSVPHLPVDVGSLGVDFLAFSAHKMLGPTGIGVLWGRAELLDAMPPFLGGGGMILDVRTDRFIPAEPPQRFEAGTPPIAEAVGVAAAVEYLEGVGMERLRDHERVLTGYALEAIADRLGDDCRVFGPPAGEDRGGVLSLAYRDVHPHDLAQVLDQFAVCVRPGHHCAKPLMRRLGVQATARASVGLYNDEHDIDVLIEGLTEAGRLFG
ncbi:MAG TPA: SufS family cysteine desulfurase [Acidimicrobiales bacterium]|nr:SufS family cysteine desulfurase [Acidimicrobiales bacterium]